MDPYEPDTERSRESSLPNSTVPPTDSRKIKDLGGLLA